MPYILTVPFVPGQVVYQPRTYVSDKPVISEWTVKGYRFEDRGLLVRCEMERSEGPRRIEYLVAEGLYGSYKAADEALRESTMGQVRDGD